jgi:glutamine cyclotransferase
VPPEEDAVSATRHWQGGVLKSPEAIGAFFIAPGRGTMPRTPARHCGNYSAGHTPHFIQGLRSIEKKWVDTKVQYLGSNIFQLELEDGQVLTRFNHEPGRLIEHLGWFGEYAISFQSDFYLLGIETGQGKAMFSLSTNPLQRCHDFAS